MPIKITANRFEDEPWRLERLERVERKIALSEIRLSVVALHDHKGCLYINFDTRPSTHDITEVSKIWSSEKECNINVYAKAIPVSADVGGINPFGGPET